MAADLIGDLSGRPRVQPGDEVDLPDSSLLLVPSQVDERGHGSAQGRRVLAPGRVTYRDFTGDKRTASLEDVDAHDVASGLPIRKSNAHRRQLSMTGERWAETAAGFVPFESLNERRFIVAADFDPKVVRITAQPFRFHLGHKTPPHVPDFMTLRADGSVRIVNVKPLELYDDDERDRLMDFARALNAKGWGYAIWHDWPDTVTANLDWLSRMNVPGSAHPAALAAAERLWDFDSYGSLERKVAAVVPGVFVRPAIDRLIWSHHFSIDLSRDLDVDTPLMRVAK
jgi:hypothetical protein